ncbi:MAG TPA: A/G-specific adenine glycosylase, partial [Thermomicrobiales bacterium]|nr:A/G-specific adenine glycosylase [Thermomicrobiales bacterium]
IAPMNAIPFTDPSPAKIDAVRERLLTWWQANRRDLPWRHTRDPYRILVSEVMLQQTQVDRVIPYYEQWLAAFPTVQALAEAPTAEVIRLWAGLGYNRRAVNLQRTAQAVVERGGDFPGTVEELRLLPGIGPYTSGAIACFAFEQDVPFIDTNMRRVLHRVFAGVDVPEPTLSDREITAIASDVIPPGDGWNWNQALIEFGALQCTARKPLCIVCPLRDACVAAPTIQTAIATLPKGARKKKEGPFKESNRYFRGRVIDILRDRDRAHRGVPLAEIGPEVRPEFQDADLPWLFEVVRGLERDGLAMVAEDEPSYDASSLAAEGVDDVDGPDIGNIRVRLP